MLFAKNMLLYKHIVWLLFKQHSSSNFFAKWRKVKTSLYIENKEIYYFLLIASVWNQL